MVYFPEKSRQFIDKGKVKVYSTQLTYPESSYFLAFNKKIVQSGKTEIINDRRKNTYKIIILLNDKLELKLRQVNTEILDSSAVLLYIAKGENRGTLKNVNPLGEAEFLEITLKSVPPPLSLTQFVDYSPRKNLSQLLVSPWGIDNSILTGHPFWISKGRFEPNHPFSYKKYDSTNSLYLFLIHGEVTINGWPLTYNDAIQLSVNEDLKLEFIKPSELLIIEMSKP